MDKSLSIPTKLFLYLLYRLLHAIIQLESDFVALVRKLTQTKDYDVEFAHILTRYTFDITDATREQDFLMFNDGFGSFEEIADSSWHIYTITDRYVYFVHVSSEDISINNHSKLAHLLYQRADRLARMDIAQFGTRTAQLPVSKCRTVILHSNPCCGATMTAKLLQAADATGNMLLVLGEPPFLTSLSILTQFISIEKTRLLTKSALKYSLRNYDKSQVVVLKARSNCARIVPYVHHANVSIQHVFISSRNPSESIVRLVENTSKQIPLFQTICRLLSHSTSICDFFTHWRILERDSVAKIGPQDAFEFALAHVMAATINYQRNLKYYALDTIFFEDLMNETASGIRPLLEICELSDLVIPECIEWKRREEAKLREIWDIVPLEDEKQERIKVLVELLQHDWNH